MKSREEVVAGRGRDIDQLDEEIARDIARAKPVAASPKPPKANDDPDETDNAEESEDEDTIEEGEDA